MSRLRRQLAGSLLAVATTVMAGCLPRGPFPPATLFGEAEGPECCNAGSCSECRRAGHHDRTDREGGAANQPPLVAPLSNFHPVPTRPVFTPWLAEEPVAEEIAGPLAWRQASTHSATIKPDDSPQGDDLSATPIARRTLPPPANLPDEKPVSQSADRPDSDTRGERFNSDWHAAGPRL